MKKLLAIFVFLLVTLIFVGTYTGNIREGFSNLSVLSGNVVGGNSGLDEAVNVLEENKIPIVIASGILILILLIGLTILYGWRKKKKEEKGKKRLKDKINKGKEELSENPLGKGKRQKLERIEKKRESSDKLEVERKIEETARLLEEGSETLAREEYRKAKELYAGLDKEDKEDIYPKAKELYEMLARRG